MPIEGLPTEGNAQAAGQEGQQTGTTQAATSDATAQNTGADATGAATQAAQTEGTTEKTFTQAEVNAMIAKRLPSAVKAELKKMGGDGEGQPDVTELQRQLSEYQTKMRSYEAKDEVSSYINDGRNKLTVEPENVRGIQELVIPRLEYDDNGKVTNLKEAIEAAKSIAPALFASKQTSGINAASGLGTRTAPANMNDLIRRGAGIGN
jgi:hypothetical protein